MSNSASWTAVIRFQDPSGHVKYGDPSADLKRATVWEGEDILHLTKTTETEEVAEILAPYVPDTILCIGLNYREHASEGGFKLPKHPIVFHKSKNSITGPFSSVVMPPQAENIDYENELCFIVSKDAKNVSEAEAPYYVFGYAVGNDVSSRGWQMPETSGGQFCFAKNFDGFCPLGPMLVSPEVIGDPQNLKIVTKRNGKVVQSSNTSDMIFGVYHLISFLSQGTTIPAGTLVMTGTPPGVAMFASRPPDFLKAGDVVECEIEKIGSLKNRFVDST